MKRAWGLGYSLAFVFLFYSLANAELYFPHVATKNGWQTQICVINTDLKSSASTTLYSYRDNGSLVGTSKMDLSPGKRTLINVGRDMKNADQIGYIILKSSFNSLVGYTKFFNGKNRVGILAPTEVNSGKMYVTHIASNQRWATGISLVNTTSSQKTLTFRFNNGATRTRSLAAGQHDVFFIRDLFGGKAQPSLTSAVVENGSGIVGLELFATSTQLSGILLTDDTVATLHYPHVATSRGWSTGVVAYNPSSASNQLTIIPYDQSGKALARSTKSLAAGAKYIGLVQDLKLPSSTAWFTIEAKNPITGFELFGMTQMLGGLPVVNLSSKSGVFPVIETNGATGIAFVNLENSKATVKLTAYGNPGKALATASKSLAAHSKYVGTPAQMFSGSNIREATYIGFQSDKQLAGFQLNLNNEQTMIDALPALFCDEIKQVFDSVLSAVKLFSGLPDLMDDFADLISQPGSSTCPKVVTTPPSINLGSLPKTITINIDFGNGCKAADGSTMKGKAIITINDLTLSETAGGATVSLKFNMSFTDIFRNGLPVFDGTVSGNVNLKVTQSNISGPVTVNFNNLQTAESTISGGLTIDVSLDITGDLSDVEINDTTMTFNNLSIQTATGQIKVTSGTVGLSSTGLDSYRMDVTMNTSQGAVDIVIDIDFPSETRAIVSTPQPGTIAGYTVSINNITFNTSVCKEYPVSGNVNLTKGSATTKATFTGACDGTYTLSR